MKRSLVLAAVALVCAGCAPAANTAPAPTQRSATPSAPVSLGATSGPQAPGGTVPPTVGIPWDQDSKDRAVDVAQKAMADFARPSVEEEQWANDLARWLTPQATADYSAVDPANIPASRVTGPVALNVDEANGYGVTAAVPTNAGTYTLQLLRTGKDAHWKVNRLAPPTP
ncbi:type-specific antigen TSA56 [Paenarthrobacter sp. NCHU4564]|uniref:type-specific antigen TSA56 n=1 Tax=Paenarthrobacter sp. NCHU4564 TaxID=3451353 RepID=UPI003F9480F1